MLQIIQHTSIKLLHVFHTVEVAASFAENRPVENPEQIDSVQSVALELLAQHPSHQK